MRGRILGLVFAGALMCLNPACTSAQAAGSSAAPSWVAEIKAVVQLDPARGERLAEAAEGRFRALPASPANLIDMVTAEWLRAEALIQLNRNVDAAKLIDKALASLPASAQETKLHGDLLTARAGIYSGDGKAHEALVDYLAAYRIFVAANQPRAQAITLQGIGSIYQDAGDFHRVLDYYSQSDLAFPGDTLLSLSSNNNQANALADLKRFADAEQKYRVALGFARKLASPMLEARILNNIAGTEIDTGKFVEAEATIKRGLQLAHGAGADAWRPMLLGTAARLQLSRGQPRRAVELIERAVQGKSGAELATQPFRDLHRTAYLAYKATGDRRTALEHFEAFTKLDNEGRSLVTLTSTSLLAARFDSVNQNARIQKLRAGQLARDIALAKIQARQNALILGGLLTVVTIVAILLGFNLRTSRRSRDKVSAANENLSRANHDLEEALSAKSAFLATTSHEIRTPLNGMLGMTQVLLADPSLAGGMRERINLVHGAGEMMRMLVDDILEFAKIDAGVLETHKVEMDLHALFRDAIGLWETQAVDKGLTLTLEDSEAPRHIFEDQRRLRQVLLNLLSNAVKFTSRGSIVVRATLERDDGAERLVISVADNGIGIPESAYETIFEKFSQLDTSTTRGFGGTGLGLAISRSIAVALGGDISVDSVVGVGSTFTVRLPLVRVAVAVAAVERAASQRAGSLAEAGVLLVGGGLIGQSVIRSLLRGAAGSFAAAPSGASALEAAARQFPDIVVIDGATVELADIVPLIAGLKGRVDKAPHILAIWSSDDGTSLTKLRDYGVDVVLARPLNGALLLGALREFFSEGNEVADQDRLPDRATAGAD